MRNDANNEYRYMNGNSKNNPAGRGNPVLEYIGKNSNNHSIIALFTNKNMSSILHESRHGGQYSRKK